MNMSYSGDEKEALMAHLDFLKKVHVFGELNDDQLTAVSDGCVEKEYRKGDKLFDEGENARHLWIVVDGTVEVRFNLPGYDAPQTNTVSVTSSTQTIGWSSFVPPYKYSLPVYCTSKTCKVLKIRKDFLLNLFERDSKMGYLFMSNIASVISIMLRQLQESAVEFPQTRIDVTVHMSTCGISAGARKVLAAFYEEIDRAGNSNVSVKSAPCIGKCSNEPNVTVEISGEEPVIYGKVSPEKVKSIFTEHILKGNIQKEWMVH